MTFKEEALSIKGGKGGWSVDKGPYFKRGRAKRQPIIFQGKRKMRKHEELSLRRGGEKIRTAHLKHHKT